MSTRLRAVLASHRRVLAVPVVLLAAAIPAVSAAVSRPKELLPPKVVSPKNGVHVHAGTRINFTVRSFRGDHYLWVHISRSPRRNFREPVYHRLCRVIKRDVRIYDLERTSSPSVYRTRTTLYHFKGFWMVTPGTYYWQAYRIEYHHADGCIETPVQKLVIAR